MIKIILSFKLAENRIQLDNYRKNILNSAFVTYKTVISIMLFAYYEDKVMKKYFIAYL